MVGTTAWGAARRARVLPIVLALAAAGMAGFLFAQWAGRRNAESRSVPPAASAPPEPAAARVAPQTVPPATYAAPLVPPAAPPAAAAAPPRSVAPAEAPPAVPLARAAAAPTAVPVAAAETTYTLQAVTEQDGQPVAIVNGQLVRVGDVVEGAHVLRIDAEAVELEKDGRRIVIAF